MKRIYILILLIFSQTLCWKQTGYKLNFHHIEKHYYNRSYLRDWDVRYDHYNRSTRAFSGYGRLMKKLDTPNLKGFGQVYIRVQNEYKIFAPLRMMVDVCKSFKANIFGLSKIVSLGNITYCPIYPGFYVVKNFIFDESYFPPNIPPGNYRAYVAILDNTIVIVNGSGFVEVKYN